MSPRLNIFLALACSLILANLYYTQTIITDIGEALSLGESARGIIVTLAQMGYVTGILLLVPLGDKVENKRLITTLIFLLSAALVVCGLARVKEVFLPGIYLVGVCCCAVQTIVPYSAGLAAPGRQGRVVGLIASGAILGIVMSRPAASFMTGLFSWRFIFLMSAGFMFMIGLVFLKILPRRQAAAGVQKYSDILSSMGKLLISRPGLKPRAIPMALVFSAFAMFWASAPLVLREELFFTQQKIALLALISLAAPICTMVAGKLADRGLGFLIAAIGIASAAVSFLLTPLWGLSAGLLALSALLLDCGTHSSGLVNQQAAMALSGQARSRLNALYMSIMFFGGAAGSSLGPWLYSHYGWQVTALAGFGLAAAALVIYLSSFARQPAMA